LPNDVVSNSLADGECTVYKRKWSELCIIYKNVNKAWMYGLPGTHARKEEE
jgi:hypothetical protein